jgi:hypothetical protein
MRRVVHLLACDISLDGLVGRLESSCPRLVRRRATYCLPHDRELEGPIRQRAQLLPTADRNLCTAARHTQMCLTPASRRSVRASTRSAGLLAGCTHADDRPDQEDVLVGLRARDSRLVVAPRPRRLCSFFEDPHCPEVAGQRVGGHGCLGGWFFRWSLKRTRNSEGAGTPVHTCITTFYCIVAPPPTPQPRTGPNFWLCTL